MPKPVHDEFSHLPVSHQRKTQLRYKRDGKCEICGDPLVTKNHCLKHAEAVRERRRQKTRARERLNSLTYRIAAAMQTRGKPVGHQLSS
jgi:hypothetical protein